MSGGSMDYLYGKVEDASFREDTPRRRAFSAHLQKVAKALHDIEWVDSCDYVKGDENAAIDACLAPGAVLAQAIADAKVAQLALADAIAYASNGGGLPRNDHDLLGDPRDGAFSQPTNP